MKRLIDLVCASVLMACALVAPAHADPAWDQVIADAKREGKLVIYVGGGENALKPVSERFEQRYGITVTHLSGRASEIRERIRTEQSTGRIGGDLTWTGASTAAPQIAEGVFQSPGALPNQQKLTPLFRGLDPVVPAFVNRFAMLVNTSLVPPGEEPKSWFDLLAPKWVGKILSDDPRAAGGGLAAFAALSNVFGREFHEKLAAQKPVLSRDFLVSQRRIAAGEFPIYIPFSVANIIDLPGLPVKPVVPQEGAAYSTSMTAILKGARNPNAARLFLDFVLEDVNQAFFENHGWGTVTGVVAPDLPKALQPIASSKLLGTLDPKQQPNMLKMFTEIYQTP